MSLIQQIEAAIITDEVGMRAARHGEYILAALYRPLYALEERRLVLSAVQGVPGIFAGRTMVSGARALGQLVAAEDRIFVMSTACVLQSDNLLVSDLGHLDLLIDPDRSLMGSFSSIARRLRPEEQMAGFMEPWTGRVILGLPHGASRPGSETGPVVAACRKLDFALAATIPDYADLAASVRPELARISATRLHELLQAPGMRAMLQRLRGLLRERGANLLVEHVANEFMLDAALSLAPDLLCGDFLGKAIQAGDCFEREEIALSDLTAAYAK